jgi:CHAD domain-containing protein
MRRHAVQQTATLLRRMAYQAGRAAKSRDSESIHDFRVSIRRLAQCLRIFGEFFPPGTAKKIRRSLKPLMQSAAEVRNRDIALELLLAARGAPDAPLMQSISQERGEAEKALRSVLKRWSRRDSFRKWRSRLEL